MSKAGKKRKIIFRISWQIGIILTVFYLILMTASLLLLAYSSTDTYLTAKNDMIERDIERMEDFFFLDEDLTGWLLDYWHKHPKEILEEETYEEMTLASDATIHGLTETTVSEYLDSQDAATQLAVAKDLYYTLALSFPNQLEEFGYGSLFVLGISEENRGFVYIQENAEDDIEKHELGDKWNYSLDDHPIARHFLSGEYDKVEFETSLDDEFNDQKYYIGAVPLMKDGEVVAVLCIGYNWNSFYTDLVRKLNTVALIMTAGVLLIYLLMLLIINRIVVKPLSILQSAAQDYTETNNSRNAVDIIKTIHSKNEIGELSHHFRDLVSEVDKHIIEIQNAEREKVELSNELLISLAQTIDAKDTYTNGHSVRVAMYSRMLADRLGFDEKNCDKIYRMGLLHDIGKIGVPNVIINKKGKLDDEEYEIIKSHTTQGYDILKRIKSFPELAEAARWHHEKYDGTGYPDRLKGAEVPLEIRIISVADSYDAMTSNRSYRSYLPQEVVKSELEKFSGTQFDPSIANQMLKIMAEDKEYQLHEFKADDAPLHHKA